MAVGLNNEFRGSALRLCLGVCRPTHKRKLLERRCERCRTWVCARCVDSTSSTYVFACVRAACARRVD